MANLSPVFVLRTKDGSAPPGDIVVPITRSLKFQGSGVTVVASNSTSAVITIGPGATDWVTSGNSGPGNVLGTNDANSFDFITNGLSRGGFLASGEYFLKGHAGFNGSQFIMQTNALTTGIFGTPFNLFEVQMAMNTVVLVEVRIQAKKTDNSSRATYIRRTKVMFNTLSVTKSFTETPYTDEENNDFAVNLVVGGTSLFVTVQGIGSEFSGTIFYQASTLP